MSISTSRFRTTWRAGVRTEDYALTLDRGLRPREVTVRFNWGINSVPQERIAEIEFVPKD